MLGGGNGTNKLNQLVRKVSSVGRKEVDSVEVVTGRRVRGTLKVIMDDHWNEC